MSAAAKPPPMSADEFLVWADRQPGDTRYELLDGLPVAMAPEQWQHGQTKFRVARLLAEAVEAKRLRCEVALDSVGVRVGPRTMFIPDVLVQCGDRPDPDSREVNDPLILVEVESPSTAQIDLSRKLVGYFSVPSVRHYLIVSGEDRTIVHHQRRADGTIETRIADDEPIRLDPPGILLEGVFAAMEG